MTKCLVLAVTALVFGLATVACFSDGRTSQDTRELSLGAGQKSSLAVDLESGRVLKVTTLVVGDPTLDIRVWIEDPSGTVVAPAKQANKVELTYGATQNGRHHVVIDNSYSIFTGKIVSVTVVVKAN